MSAVDAEGLRRNILVYAGLALAAMSLVISAVAIGPLAIHLRDSALASLGHTMELKAVASEEFLGRARSMAVQVTSRSGIRDKLAAYHRGEVTETALADFTRDKLADALSLSPELAGIARFDAQGRLIVMVGHSFTMDVDDPPPVGVDELTILAPREMGSVPYVLILAPIRSPSGLRIGTDAVLINSQRLVSIIRDTRNLGATGDVALVDAREHPRALLPFGGGRAGAVEMAFGTNEVATVTDAVGALHAVSRRAGPVLLVATHIPSVGWTLLLRVQSREATAAVDRLILMVAGGAAALTVVGIFGLMLVLQPLTGAFIVQSSDVRRQFQELGRVKAELDVKTRQLAMSTVELQEYAYAASHDLQEPLRTVTSFSQLLARRYRGRLGSEADEFIAYIIEGAERMGRQINDLLAYACLGGDEVPTERIDLDAVVADILAGVRPTFDESGAVVTISPLPPVHGTRDHISRLLQNLIANGLKFSPPGVAARVDISAQMHDDKVEVIVRDEGIGIDPEYQDRIFHMFKRLHPRGSYEGSGIGLAMCRKIAENHGGRIWVVSRLGEGASFHVLLPPAG
jgi:signal transduction histidine kinase